MKIFGQPIYTLLGFNDLRMRIALLPVLAMLMPMAFFQTYPWNDLSIYMNDAIGSLIYSSVYWHFDRLVIAYFRGRYPAINDYVKRVIYQSIIIVIATFTLCYGILALTDAIGLEQNINRPSDFELNLASLVITVAIASIYEAVYAFQMWKRSFIESEKLKKENMQAQLETLKNQVNPHFLFNSLNTLTSMIHEQPDQAVEFVEKLSKVYRYILEIKDKEMISLHEELECINAYRFLLEMRFGHNVQFTVDIPSHLLDYHIVPLSLQILLENAIKHNVVSTNKPLHIGITTTPVGNILVSNNLQKKNTVNGSTKTGIANINNRYKLLTGKEVDVIVTQDQFSVVVPLIKVNEDEVVDY